MKAEMESSRDDRAGWEPETRALATDEEAAVTAMQLPLHLGCIIR